MWHAGMAVIGRVPASGRQPTGRRHATLRGVPGPRRGRPVLVAPQGVGGIPRPPPGASSRGGPKAPAPTRPPPPRPAPTATRLSLGRSGGYARQTALRPGRPPHRTARTSLGTREPRSWDTGTATRTPWSCHRARDPTPGILPRHPHGEIGDGLRCRWPAGAASWRAAVLRANELPVPAQDGVSHRDAGNLAELLPALGAASDCQSATLVVGQPETSTTELLTEDAVLLHQVLDQNVLAALHQIGEEHKERGERLRQRGHGPRMSRQPGGRNLTASRCG